jgi:hypothetical protein
MGLSLVAFFAALGILAFSVGAWRRAKANAAARIEFVVGILLAAYAALRGAAALGSTAGDPAATALVARAAAATVSSAGVLLLGFALAFPRWPRAGARFALIPIGGAALAALAFAFLAPSFLAGVKFGTNGYYALPGPSRPWFDIAVGALGLLAGIVQGLRLLLAKDRISRERSSLAFGAIILGLPGLWLLQRVSLSQSGQAWAQVLPPMVALAMVALLGYALAVSRLFDWREFFRTLAGYLGVAVVVGLPLGAILYVLVLLSAGSVLALGLGSLVLFFIALRAARAFLERFFSRLSSTRDYKEVLGSALAHIDLSAGRDAVLSDLTALLQGEIGCNDLGILIEDDRAVLRTVWSSGTPKATLERSSAVRTVLERSSADVLMLSEVQADEAWAELRTEILGLFSELGAETLVLAREGRRIIGIFAFGPRRTGGAYTAYDYGAFQGLCGKLFVFAFYLKNVARESILYTVDRELALSDQIIRFALEHVAPVDHPKADAAWAMKSTRRLGGDFVDFVKIGRERYFFVLGDVSGKGLSASMNMLILKSMIRTFLKIEKDFSSLVQRVNAFIKDYLPKGSFFAGVFGYFDFEKNALYFINCGVPAILLYSPSFDAFVEVQGEGKILGFVRDVKPLLKPRKIGMAPGTALVVCTDGLLDSENIRGERYGKDRLRKAARDGLAKPSRTIADGVMADLLRFTENRQEDDITLLVMKIK